MKTFSEFLNERYVNALSTSNKEKYKQQVWDILQRSYKPIGGIHGSGFNSPDDMVKNIPMWKMVKRGEEVVAVAMYKDKAGRKRVAVGTDGSDTGRQEIRKIAADDFERAFAEVSGPSFFSLLKTVGQDFLEKYAKTRDEAEKILREPLGDPDDGDPMVQRVPELKKFMYSRDIGREQHTKIMFGSTGKKIVNHQ